MGGMRKTRRSLAERIRGGCVEKRDVNRRLAELAFGKVNDCVKLALVEEVELDGLDLSLLAEVKKNDKGAVEIRLVDRLKVLQQLAEVVESQGDGMEGLIQAIQGGERV